MCECRSAVTVAGPHEAYDEISCNDLVDTEAPPCNSGRELLVPPPAGQARLLPCASDSLQAAHPALGEYAPGVIFRPVPERSLESRVGLAFVVQFPSSLQCRAHVVGQSQARAQIAGREADRVLMDVQIDRFGAGRPCLASLLVHLTKQGARNDQPEVRVG